MDPSDDTEQQAPHTPSSSSSSPPAPPMFPFYMTSTTFFYYILGQIWEFFQNFGWFVLLAVLLYFVLKDPLTGAINGYMARARLRAAKDPKRVASLDDERRQIREQQQREYLIEKERRAKEEKEEKEKKAEEFALANAELRAAGNPTTEATRRQGTFMGPSRPGDAGGRGGAHRFGNERQRRP